MAISQVFQFFIIIYQSHKSILHQEVYWQYPAAQKLMILLKNLLLIIVPNRWVGGESALQVNKLKSALY